MPADDRDAPARSPEPSAGEIRKLELATGLQKTQAICSVLNNFLLSAMVITGMVMIGRVILDPAARKFIGPYAWWLLLLVSPSLGIVPLIKLFLQRSGKDTRRSRALEKRLDPHRTSSLPPGNEEEDDP